MNAKRDVFAATVGFLFLALIMLGTFGVLQSIFAANIGSQVVVGNAAPTVSSVSVNNTNNITLNPNTTTNISVNATITDNNGCVDINAGTTTILLYRSGVSSSTCMTTPNNLNCYRATAFTVSSTCSGTSITTTSTFAIQYYAQATDSSSTFPTQNWMATVYFSDPFPSTGNADSLSGTTPDVLTLNAINVTTSSINYGTVPANTDTGSTNQIASSTNAGNSSTTLQLNALSTLTSGANSIATSSQHYATSTFTYGGNEQALTQTAATVNGFFLTSPTSSNLVSQATYWGLAVPGGTATGTYTGTNVFSSLFQP
jgi:hypothetical protein